MNDELKLLEIFRRPRPGDEEIARRIVTQTPGWPAERLEAAFDVALNSGLLNRADAEALLARFGSTRNLESLPELTQFHADAQVLEQQRARLQAEHEQVFSLQSRVYELEKVRERDRQTSQSLKNEIIRLEEEMQRLDELIGEANP